MYPLLADLDRSSTSTSIARWPSNTAIFLPGGRVPKVGEKFVQSDLARTLQYMADQDRAAGRRTAMAGLRRGARCVLPRRHRREIVALPASRRAAIWRWTTSPTTTRRIEPVVRRAWRGHEVITCGPWCQGPVLLQALALVERVGIDGLAHNSRRLPAPHRRVPELALADREYHFGDPRFVDVPIDHLLDPATIARRARGGARRARVRRDAARRSDCARNAARHPAKPARAAEGGGRHLVLLRRRSLGQRVQRHAVATARGNVAGGARASASCPSGRGSQSRPDPRHPVRRRARQAAAPHAQPGDGGDRRRRRDAVRHARAATCRPRRCCRCCSTSSSSAWRSQDAIEAPRVRDLRFPSSFAPFEYFPGRLAVEGRLPAATIDELAARGHEVEMWPALDVARRLGGGDPARQQDRVPAGGSGLAAAGLCDCCLAEPPRRAI